MQLTFRMIGNVAQFGRAGAQRAASRGSWDSPEGPRSSLASGLLQGHLSEQDSVRVAATGIEVEDRAFGRFGRVVLRLLGRMPSSLSEHLLFEVRGAAVMQKALQGLVGGPRDVRVHFAAGPIAGWDFECSTAERYFLLGARYETAVTEALRTVVQTTDVVYDIGAHAGFSTLMFARLAARVYAFEPSPLTFQRLRHNVELNQVHAVTAVNAGVWDNEAQLRLVEKGSWSWVIDVDAPADGEVSDVRLLRLDDFVYRDGELPATFLKIDVEGNAARCLTGAQELLRRTRPRVLLELHDSIEERDCLAILHEHGYHARALDAAGRYPYHVMSSVKTPSFPGPGAVPGR